MWSLQVGVSITDQGRDPLHARPDGVGIEMIDLAIELGGSGLEPLAGGVVERVRVSLRHFLNQKAQVLVPLIAGEAQVFGCLAVAGEREQKCPCRGKRSHGQLDVRLPEL